MLDKINQKLIKPMKLKINNQIVLEDFNASE
jgi:hypothetical protein